MLVFFNRERLHLVRLIQRIVRDPDVAEDLAQDAWLKVMDKDETNLSYLYKTAQNLALDYLRGQKVRHGYAEQALHEQEEMATGALEDAVVAAESLEQHLNALQSLPERTQRIFLLNRLDGMSYSTIARELNLSVSTVEKEMIRAIQVCVRMQPINKNRKKSDSHD